MPAKAEKSFEELAVPHLELVYRVARRLCRNEHEAEDLVQETYLKAYKAFERFEMREFGIKPWLLKILHNTFLNRLARQRRAPRLADGPRSPRMPSSTVFNRPVFTRTPACLTSDQATSMAASTFWTL